MLKPKKLPVASCSSHIRDTKLGIMFGIIGYASTIEAARRLVLKNMSRDSRQLMQRGFDLLVFLVESDHVGNACGEDCFIAKLAKK